MWKKLSQSLPALLMVACADTSDRYRDIQHLEMPPELPIEHTHNQTTITQDDLRPKVSALSNLMAFEDIGDKPLLTLRTRPDRAWEIVSTALKISNLQILDMNREQKRFQVRYDADVGGEESGIFDEIFNNNFEEADYTISLKEGISGVVVNAELSKPDELEFGDDASAELIRFLHKTIDEKIINRDATSPAED